MGVLEIVMEAGLSARLRPGDNRSMNSFFFLISIVIFLSSCSTVTSRIPNAAAELPGLGETLEQVIYPPLKIKMRAGFSPEAAELKGCVLYLQGLADSVRNHQPYFSFLNRAGYRVIFFDYLGQGGSEGSMNSTRVQVELPPTASSQMKRKYDQADKFYEIQEQAEFFWNRYRSVTGPTGQVCTNAPTAVIGWSTGGLAAYRMAHERRAKAVILLAPGLHPKWMVGESAERWDKMILLRQTITEPSLTRNRFENQNNPHRDPIMPKSPAHVPRFAGNLLGVASHSKNWTMDRTVPGLVFLSGAEDTYVDREATIRTLSLNAPHFEVVTYDGALHELDNELPSVTADLYQKSVDFLDWQIIKSKRER